MRRWLFLVLVCALLLGASFFGDSFVKGWVTEHQVSAMRAFMRGVSWWGDWPQHVAIGLVAAGIAYARGNRRWVVIFAAMIIACAVAGAANRAIKIGAGRSRPLVEADAGWNGLRFSSKYNAFPSGHTAASTAFFGTLLLARRRIGLALLPVPLLIAASRLYLNAHHLSDVVAGAIVGVLSTIVVWHFLSARMRDAAPRPLAISV